MALITVSLEKVKLGTSQRGMLHALHGHGYWHGGGYGCGWLWSTRSRTQAILDSLVKRGLVATADEPLLSRGRLTTVWRLTDLGRKVVSEAKP